VPEATPLVLVALDQCGLELGAPHLVTRTKRRVETSAVDVASLAHDGLRFVGWDPERIEVRYDDLDPAATNEIEAIYVCERDVERRQAMTAGELDLHPPIELVPATSTTVRVPVPAAAVAAGRLELAIDRLTGPDAVVSELRLFSSRPPRPLLTVVGDSAGGLLGSVAHPDSSGVAGVAVAVRTGAGELQVETDAAGLFRVPLGDLVPPGQQADVTVTATVDGEASAVTLDTRAIARGLREMPPDGDRIDLAGEWTCAGGPFRADGTADGDRTPGGGGAAATRVPGHIIFDGLTPEDGVATLRRSFDLPDPWADGPVLLRCDGAYGRAEVRVNGALVGGHGAGSTSFDIDLSGAVRPGANELAVTLTEFTPYAVLDDMSWYAHLSLLGIWREIVLFRTGAVSLGQLDLATDWDPHRRAGSLSLATDVINLDAAAGDWTLDVVIRDDRGGVVAHGLRRGSVGARSSTRAGIELEVADARPWSAEEPALHDLEVSLTPAGGAVQSYRRRIGFRRIEVRDRQLLVNGAPIRVRGVNRHDSRILTGRALSADDLREDVVNLRRLNVNVIRTSHYPPSPRLLEICDEVGMFVLEQPPICFSGGFDDHRWNRTNEAAQLVPYLLEVTAETVRRDRGHASVIVWDLGNESRWGAGFDAQLAMVRAIDPGRPTIFSFDLNELGPENPLVRKAPADRPDIRSYHYPGWDRTWGEDLSWLGSYDQPVILDEYAPVFAPCRRGPGEAYGLAIDPGIRDYWGLGYQPFMEAALGERGVLGGLIWGGFGEVFVIPLDLTIGEGPWAHLPVTDYIRTRDHYPPEPGVFRRGDGDWGIFDAWNRPRPEAWHVHEMYAPVRFSGAVEGGRERLTLTLANRFSHRSLDGLDVRVVGGELVGAPDLAVPPGDDTTLVIRRSTDADDVRVELWHPEGWLVASHLVAWPGAGTTPQAAVLARAHPARIEAAAGGSIAIVSDDGGTRWLDGWPALHVLDVNEPHLPVPGPRPVPEGFVVESPDGATVPLAGGGWQGTLSARIADRTVVFDYAVTYDGPRSFHAKEVGLSLRPSPELADLWWRRIGEWTTYPADHVGRTAGSAPAAPGANDTLHPAPTWEADATAAGSNDYRSAKRAILAAGLSDGERSLSVLSDGTQHVRAELVEGAPVLHVLDRYGGVRTVEGNHPIWSAYFGFGLPIEPGTEVRGTVTVAIGDRPAM
jgi:hypothetical protein